MKFLSIALIILIIINLVLEFSIIHGLFISQPIKNGTSITSTLSVSVPAHNNSGNGIGAQEVCGGSSGTGGRNNRGRRSVTATDNHLKSFLKKKKYIPFQGYILKVVEDRDGDETLKSNTWPTVGQADIIKIYN